MNPSQDVTLGVVIPCRDEARVLGRKLANLGRASWPAGGGHVVAVVDDGSSDATSEVAQDVAARTFRSDGPVAVRVAANDGSPGKPGAIATGIAAVGDVDLIVLTDADVILHPEALVALAAAFARAPELAMASGAQWFVHDLDPDGEFRSADRGELVRADGTYDRWTAWVRRFESRSGRLFSVHGQLLAWRRSLGLRATPGLAADDLDLRMQVRARTAEPRRVELVPTAIFAEAKETAQALDDQAVRRARAYLQTVSWRPAPALEGALDRLQLAAYRYGPLWAPWLALGAALAAPALGAAVGGLRSAGVGVLLLVGLACLPAVRRLTRLLVVIARAQRIERSEPLGDRWEMARR